jgi:hypothetical protein
MTVMRVNMEKPLPQPAAFTSANEADGFATRTVASLLTGLFQNELQSRKNIRKDGHYEMKIRDLYLACILTLISQPIWTENGALVMIF